MRNTHSPFTDRSAVATYATDTPRKVPGLADLHRMTAAFAEFFQHPHRPLLPRRLGLPACVREGMGLPGTRRTVVRDGRASRL